MTTITADKSLQQLDGQDWGEPTFDSHLVRECHRLRRVPLRDFTVENLRIMIGQDIGSDYLVPIALERLRSNPLSEGDCYLGDLLVNVLRLGGTFWQRHSQWLQQVADIAKRAISICSVDDYSFVTRNAIQQSYEQFQSLAALQT